MTSRKTLALWSACLLLSCGSPQVASEEQARQAWLGLDLMVGKALTLGFAGFNAASSANIPAQSTSGNDGGTLTITGQVDQGASANKGMRLKVGLVDYSDGNVVTDGGTPVVVTYATATDAASQPALTLSLKNIPSGTYTGTLLGDFSMRGSLVGTVKLDLAMSGQLEDDGSGHVRRKAGATSITGTAASDAGVYQVSLTE